MNRTALFLAVLAVAVCAAGPAAADPLTALISLVSTTFGVTTAVATFVVQLGLSAALSALGAVLAGKPSAPRAAGIKTDTTTTGGDNPESFILGRYATAGHLVAPPYSHPNDGALPNEYLTYVVEVSGVAGVGFERIIVAGAYVEDLQPSAGDHDQEGLFEGGQPHLFLSWHDGTQSAADAYMMANYAAHPERPWAADMVGQGLSYAVVTFRYNRELFNALPGVRFEVQGIPLYDPRYDSSVGGTGAQRWSDPATWAQTDNPIVMVYNILRGIALPGGRIWGGGAAEADLPLGNWFAAMNECDVAVSLKGGGTEPQYRAGLEVTVDQEPGDVIDELLKACSAEIAPLGGVYKVRVGPPALPSYVFTDDDIVADVPQSLQPSPGLEDTHNAIHASHPAPDALWETRDAPPRYNAAWEAEDGGRQLVAQVDLPAVTSDTQVQRLMQAWINDERRFRRHVITLPPEAAILEPLDTVGWTSARNGYSAKVFEVGDITDDLPTLLQTVSLREREAGDFTWTPASDEIDVVHPSSAKVVPAGRAVPGFTVTKKTLSNGGVSRPALQLGWTGADMRDTEAIEFEIERAADGSDVATGVVSDATKGRKVVRAGILPATQYRARARVLARRKGPWTAWTPVTTDDVRLSAGDLEDALSVAAQPTGLALSTVLLADGVAQIAATWNAAAGAAGYELGVTRAGGNEVIVAAGETRFELETQPGTGYDLRVRAVSGVGAKSAWTAVQSITAATDSTPPSVPTGVSATPGFTSIWVEFTASPEADVAYYEVVYKNSNTTPTSANPRALFLGRRGVIDGLSGGVTKWIFVRAIDTSGNASGWTAGVSATTLAVGDAITTGDLVGLVDATSFAAGLTGVEIVGTLPTTGNFEGRYVYLSADAKLYRYSSGAWTNEVDGADLKANSITTGAIAAGAIGTQQLAARAATIGKLGVGDFTNLNPDTDYDDSGLWNGASSFTTVTNADWGGKRKMIVTGAAGAFAFVYGPQFGIDPEGGELLVRARAKIQTGASGGTDAVVNLQLSNVDGDFTAAVNVFGAVNFSATSVAEVAGTFVIPAGYRFARLRLYKSDTSATEVQFGAVQIYRRNAGELVVDGGIKSNHLVTNQAVITVAAQIASAVIGDAHINSLSAAKLLAGTALASSITVNGTALATVESRAADPASQVNAGSVKIAPGQILVSGATTLSDWRKTGDETRIDGGQISANTVTADKANFTDLASLNLTVANADIENLAVDTLKIADTAIITGKIQDEAVSLGAVVSNVTGRMVGSDSTQQQAIISLGPVDYDYYWKLGFVQEIRGQTSTTAGSTYTNVRMRTKTGGVWSSWSTVYQSNPPNTGTVWAVTSYFHNFFGKYDDVEFEINAIAELTVAFNEHNNVRRTYIVARSNPVK